MASQRTRTGVAALTLVGQAVVLFAPRAPRVELADGAQVDKLIHAAVFAAATWGLLWAGAPRIPVLSAMAAYAPVSELIQGSLFPQRSGEGADIVADLIGVALGVWAHGLANRPAQLAGFEDPDRTAD